jgi:hypothetical protein
MSIPLIKILQRLKLENLHGLLSNDLDELDARDPRWFELFLEYFTSLDNEVQDDLLFFVRLKHSLESEPIFVKRRVAGSVPALSDVVAWKETFFLNLISQLPCTLIVSVCSKGSDSKTMIAKSRCVKKVYSAPYKSRMDVKEAMMNEISFPIVYYTVNDYEADEVNLEIAQNEYLCVELSVLIPNHQTSDNYKNASHFASLISLQEDHSPSPIPDGFEKIVLFHGAVAFSSLCQIYYEKGLAAQNQMKNSWPRLGPLDTASTLRRRKEFVMMKPPSGKGQCQVAIVDNSKDFTKDNDQVNNSLLGYMIQSFKFNAADQQYAHPEKLLCSFTYVNIQWQDIINAFMQFDV